MSIVQTEPLPHRVDILTPSATTDAGGRPSGYTPFLQNLPARVKDLAGKELADAQKIVDQVTHVVVLRYQDGLKGKMRVIFDTRTFEIQAPLNPDGRKVMHRLLCIEVANA